MSGDGAQFEQPPQKRLMNNAGVPVLSAHGSNELLILDCVAECSFRLFTSDDATVLRALGQRLSPR